MFICVWQKLGHASIIFNEALPSQDVLGGFILKRAQRVDEVSTTCWSKRGQGNFIALSVEPLQNARCLPQLGQWFRRFLR